MTHRSSLAFVAFAVASGTRLIFVAEQGREVDGIAGAGQIYVYRVAP